MSSNACRRSASPRALAGRAMAVALSVSAGACSADVTRFDFPAFSLNESNRPTGALTGSQGYGPRADQGYDAPGAPPRGYGYGDPPPPPQTYGGGYGSPQPGAGGYGGERVASAGGYAPQSAPLPPIVPEHRAPPAAQAEVRGMPESARQTAAPAYETGRTHTPAAQDYTPEPPRTAGFGDTIEVQEGDTLYAISKRYNVSLADLIDANRLHHGARLKPGQRLVLPDGAVARQARREARGRPPVAMVPVAKAPVGASIPEPTPMSAPPPPPSPPSLETASGGSGASGWNGRHTVKPGETLYGISRQYKISLAELQRANGIDNPLRVKAGTTLTVPGAGVAEAAPEPAPAPRAPAYAQDGPAGAPRIINRAAEKKVAARSDQASDAEPSAAAPVSADPQTTGRFRWPARGRVIAGYGKRADGTHNDGINLAVPLGTEVHAAESGKVAYAGNELKGYGNLILIRHDNGWVSAYAHNDQLLVKRDDVVRRGQVIAKAGNTGTVDQPQLHFELRQGSKPVDPLLHLEKN